MTCGPVLADHVVSMQTAPGERLAVCACGWSWRGAWDDADGRETAVLTHWQAVLAVWS